jgi:hypothetical protein
VKDAKEKLWDGLLDLNHSSPEHDLMIFFDTSKKVLSGPGAK